MLDRYAKLHPHLGVAQWAAIGLLEMVGAFLLIVPAATRWKPMLTPLAAAVLAVETFALAILYARYSLEIAATNPLVWAVVIAALAAFVAYGRYALVPKTASTALQ